MSVAPAAPVVPVTRESFGIPADEDPWSQVPDPTNPLNTARAFFEHFLQDNGGLRKENDGEPRRYANGESLYIPLCVCVCVHVRVHETCMCYVYPAISGPDMPDAGSKATTTIDVVDDNANQRQPFPTFFWLTSTVFFDFRRGRSKYYRDVLGIDNGKVSTLASQDWQLVKVSTAYMHIGSTGRT